MKIPDRKMIIGVGLAFLLWYFVFISDYFVSFWYRVTLSAFILTIYAYPSVGVPRTINFKEIVYGLGTGVLLYGLFLIGFNIFKPFLEADASSVYIFRDELPLVIPTILLLFTSFSEEYFWRSYVQKKFVYQYGKTGILITSALYALIHLSTLNIGLIAAAFIAGLVWGITYDQLDSLWVVVFSHLVWTELIFVFLPLL
jgi:uncharacterized protein